MTTTQATFAEKLNTLRAAYARQLPMRIREVEEGFAQLLQAPEDAAIADLLHRLLHNLVGSSGTMGFAGVCSAAAALKSLVRSCTDSGLRGDTLRSQATSHLSRMKKASRRQEEDVLEDLASDDPSGHERENRLIYVLEDDRTQAESLAAQLGHYGYLPRTFARIEDLQHGLEQAMPAAVIVDIILPEGALAGARGIATLRTLRKLPIPVLFLTVRSDLQARVEAVRAGADGYFTKPGDVTALLERLDFLTARRVPEPYRILVVDDDVLLSQYFAGTLRQAGMIVSIVNDPFQVEQPLQDLRPDLILMDLNMPGCTGQELGGAIRQQPDFVGIPIVFLSSETQVDKQLAARSVGAEDFLTKPIQRDRLIAEVSLRAERARALRVHMIRDGQTGLLNHSSFMSQLHMEILRARRRSSPLSFAMIDVDRFKSINDRFGHSTGDRVLRSLAHFLQKRLRKTDLIGRCGGDEFAVALVDADPANAARVLDEIRASFAQLQHASGQQTFHVGISIGLATFPACPDAKLLKDAADRAMYEGKRRGGNRLTVSEENQELGGTQGDPRIGNG
jgi:diguanylate cyclase (GGDEF)-like protein